VNEAPDDHDQPRSWDTTFHVRRATAGDPQSLDAVIARLSPVLMAVAEYRLGPGMRLQADPEDLVNEAWLVTLPRLDGLEERDGRITPVLLRFLTTTINNLISNLLRRQIRGRGRGSTTAPPESRVPSDMSGAVTRAMRHEAQATVRKCIDELASRDREIVLLRGIEQNSSKTVATLLDLTVATVDKRYSRALARLRQRLPESVFDELHDFDCPTAGHDDGDDDDGR
jgi:RNA polymerase sigma-70 factor (ECF subfamily)